MHYHQAYWSIQAPLSCFLSWRLIFALHALGQNGLAGQVVRILSWTSMRHTYLIIACQSALQRLTSLHPWANTLWSALRKSAWPYHWVPTHASAVLWHACQLCHDIYFLHDFARFVKASINISGISRLWKWGSGDVESFNELVVDKIFCGSTVH